MKRTSFGFKMGRRRFVVKLSHLAVLGGGTLLGWGASPFLGPGPLRLRPPGAVGENKFLATCIKCGQCQQVCPPQVVMLAHLQDGFGIGTPYIVAREGGCILCRGLPCVLSCPTGALDHNLSDGKNAEMGLAVLTAPERCLAMLGQDCRICLDECPIKEEKPIVFKRHKDGQGGVYHEPVVQHTCVGCGFCEEKCPTKPTSITIIPRRKWETVTA